MKLYRYILGLLLLACMCVPAVAQQGIIISGIVLDEKSVPVIGANIIIPGTKIGSVTNLDGKFTLKNVPSGEQKIQVSYIGYKQQQIKVTGSQRDLTIKLSPANSELDEVVVVGYAVQKKAHLTGSISTIAPKDIADLTGSNLGSTLRGQVTGLSVAGGNTRPGEQSRLTIRQSDITSSFSTAGESSPLYVIDGFITNESAFNNLDATMVENISVLKDAAAAVYGARSANGVILVTTKRGKLGKPKISYNTQIGITDEIQRAKMLSAYDYGKIWNGIRGSDPTISTNNRTALFQSDELDAMRGLNYDLLDQKWKAATTQKHSINITGATEAANYFAGISYFTQDGNLGKIDYNRWNYRAGADFKISSSLKASLQISGDNGSQRKSYSKIGGENSETDYNLLLTHPRYIPEYVNGRAIATYGITNPIGSSLDDSQLYHYDVIQNLDNYTQNVSDNISLNSSIEYGFGWSKILKGLNLKFSYSRAVATTKSNQYASNYNLYRMIQRAGSGEHLYTGDNINIDASNFAQIPVTNGNLLRRAMSRNDRYQMNFIASYNRTFGKHDVSGLFSIEKSEAETEDLIGSVSDPYSFTNGQSNSATGTQSTSFTRLESGTLSYIGRVNYVYGDKYLAEFLIRSDASTKFAPENYWGLFPSLSTGWVISQEEWFEKNIPWINYLKLRTSIGLLGRDNTKAWTWATYYGLDKDKGPIFGTTGSSTSSGPHISVPDITANRNAHWDKSYKSNYGLDFNVLQNKLNFSIDGYYEWNRDIFVPRTSQVPWTVGARPAAENYGSVDVYGVEFSVGWRDKIGSDFKYNVRLNTGYSDNKIIKMPWPTPIPIDQKHPGRRNDTGSWGLECMGMFRSYQEIEEYFSKYNITNYMGLTKDGVRPGMLIYKDIRGAQNADGSYSAADGKVDAVNDIVQISSRSNPYGFTLNLGAEWKNLSFSAQMSASWGGYDFIPQKARSASSLTSTATGVSVLEYTNLPSFWKDNMFVYKDVIDASGNVVASANRDAKYPNLAYSINSQQSTFWKISGTRASLNQMTVAYSIPKKLAQKASIESCRINVTGQDLLSFLNPYPDNFMNPLSGSYGTYPNLRKITIGINVGF